MLCLKIVVPLLWFSTCYIYLIIHIVFVFFRWVTAPRSNKSCWRYGMEALSTLLGHLWGESTSHPHKGSVMWSFDISRFKIALKIVQHKLLNKQLSFQWHAMSWRSCNINVMYITGGMQCGTFMAQSIFSKFLMKDMFKLLSYSIFRMNM